MASHKENKMPPSTGLPTCPVCLQSMAPPIFMCQTGHSVCGRCTRLLRPPNCPVCQQPMTQIRNRSLEDFINVTKIPCPHRAAGCLLSPKTAALKEHVLECCYRAVECPLDVGRDRCSWTGTHEQITNHFKAQHPRMFTENMEAEIEVERMTLLECNRRVSVAVQRRNIFIITFKVDTIRRLAYWTVQYMGPKKYAHTFDYEIHLSNKHEPRRKVIFREYCTSDSVKTEDIFSKCCCAVLSLNALQTFSIGDKV